MFPLFVRIRLFQVFVVTLLLEETLPRTFHPSEGGFEPANTPYLLTVPPQLKSKAIPSKGLLQ